MFTTTSAFWRFSPSPLRRHLNEKAPFQPLRKIFQDGGLESPQENRFEGLGNPGEIPVAGHSPAVVRLLVRREETEGGSEPESVHEFHDGMEFLQPVFERRARQDDRILGLELLDALRGSGLPVFDPLGLVQDDEVRRPPVDQLPVAVDHVVVRDLEKGLRLIGSLAALPETIHRQGRPRGESLDFTLPLVLEGGGADD